MPIEIHKCPACGREMVRSTPEDDETSESPYIYRCLRCLVEVLGKAKTKDE